MWSSLVLAAAVALGPTQAGGGVKLTNVRLTVGELGGTRPDAKLLPGDVLFIAYDIDGIAPDADGNVKYSMTMELLDPSGKGVFKENPREIFAPLPLGGTKIPARAFVTVGLDQDPGTYACRITVTDPATKQFSAITQKFDVLKRDFGLVAVYTSYDVKGEITAPTTNQVGQTVFVWFSVVGFTRDPKTRQPNIEFEFTPVDAAGKGTLPKPLKDVVDAGIDEKDGGFARHFPLFMNRPGRFTVRLKASDKVANRVVTYDLPITVLGAN